VDKTSICVTTQLLNFLPVRLLEAADIKRNLVLLKKKIDKNPHNAGSLLLPTVVWLTTSFPRN
jgi:hypothetical protein